MSPAAYTPIRHYSRHNFGIPLPVLGWNTKDPINSMDMRYAAALDNLIPKEHYLELRKGYKVYCPFDRAPAFLTTYEYGSLKHLLCACGGYFYKVDQSGEKIKLNQSPFSFDYWQDLRYKGRVYLFNGQDAPQVYDGETLQNAEFSASEEYSADFEAAKIFAGVLHSNRLFLLEKNSLKFWYTKDAGAVRGEVTPFDLSMIAKHGGTLAAAAQISPLSEESLIGFLTTNGEFIVYAGDNPGEISAWALKARIKIPKPLGPNCFEEFYGETAYLSQEGCFLLSQLLQTAATNKRAEISDKINTAIGEYQSRYTQPGWQIKHSPQERWLIVNIPARGGAVQHVMNTETGAWCRFTGINANCFAVLENKLYFAGASKSGQGLFVFDNVYNDAAAQTPWNWQTPYTNFNNPLVKRILESNILLKANSNFVFDFSVSADFVPASKIYSGGVNEDFSKWDAAVWDLSKWAPEAKARKQRVLTLSPAGQYYSFGLSALGYNQPLQIIGMDIFYEQGSNLI